MNKHYLTYALVLVALSACAGNPSGLALGSGNTSSEASARLTAAGALDLRLCETSVSNPPDNESQRVLRTSAYACADGIKLLVAPAPGACVTSGFGQRRGRLHAGIDYQSKPAGAVVAAADGVVSAVDFRQKDYGNWIVISHGKGIHTGYAHLASVSRGVTPGATVKRGQPLGVMGKTGNATKAIHLHVEYRAGKLSNRKGWWGLVPFDPFSKPECYPPG